MTKAEELKALEQIADIIESCGDDSYIGKAFEGCYLIAKENIENDFFDSWKSRAERRDSETLKYRDKVEDLEEAYSVVLNRVKEESEKANLLTEKNKTLQEECIKNWNAYREQEDRADALEQEVIKLKAKLYDLLCK